MKKRIVQLTLVMLCILLTGLTAIADGKLVLETIHSKSLENNLIGDSPDKAVTIYLPPSYDEGNNIYPVAYYLNGFTANNTCGRISFLSIL